MAESDSQPVPERAALAPVPGPPRRRVDAVLVAAGASRRMEGRDKLEAVLGGRPVLRWAVDALVAAGVERIVLVTSVGRVAGIAGAAWLPDQVVAVVAGGTRRQESVAAGVAALDDPLEDASSGMADAAGALTGAVTGPVRGAPRGQPAVDPVVLVHDAARPFASPALVRAVADAAARHGAAIPVLPITETLKRLDGDWVGETIDRAHVGVAQTPQGVRRSLLLRAYEAYPPAGPETWTDEASLLEACRIPVHAIQGEPDNIKVTVPADLERAEALLQRGLRTAGEGGPPAVTGAEPDLATGRTGRVGEPTLRVGERTLRVGERTLRVGERTLRVGERTLRVGEPTLRVGFGTDSHPFGPGDALVLGGLRIEGAPRLYGHSDGDVALHAVADALLGGAGLGDLGRLFPADARTPVGVDSRELLATVVTRAGEAGWRPSNVDLTIVAARPRLGALLPGMGETIAAILGLEPAAVNVKASTGNLSGPEGTGRAISAAAVVSLVPIATRSAP